jgi:hypothetical protein
MRHEEQWHAVAFSKSTIGKANAVCLRKWALYREFKSCDAPPGARYRLRGGRAGRPTQKV